MKSKKKHRHLWLSAETVRVARHGRKGTPTEADVPPPTPLPGPKRKPLPGQLDIDGNEVGALADVAERGRPDAA